MHDHLAFLAIRLEHLAEHERREYDQQVAAHTTTLWQRAIRALERRRQATATPACYQPSRVSQ